MYLSPMVRVSNYDFNHLTENIVKPEESFINAYVDKCLKCESKIGSTHRMCRIIYAKYKKSDRNKVMTKIFLGDLELNRINK